MQRAELLIKSIPANENSGTESSEFTKLNTEFIVSFSLFIVSIKINNPDETDKRQQKIKLHKPL